MSKQSTLLKALFPLTLALVSGCQGPQPMYGTKQPLFALGQSDAAASLTVPGEAPGSVVSRPGTLTVNFGGEVTRISRQRHVLAALTDVDHVTVTVKASNGAEFSKTVDKAAIANGMTSVSFDALPAGLATVTVSVFNSAGATIGQSLKSATVVAGQVSSVTLDVRLQPNYVGAGGGTTPTTGGLNAQVTLTDGDVVSASAAGEMMGAYDLDFMPYGVAIDRDGNAWVSGTRVTDPMGGRIEKFSPTGSLLGTLDRGGCWTNVVVDGQGQVWAFDGTPGGTVIRLNPDLTVAQEFSSGTDDDIWNASVGASGQLYFLAHRFMGGDYLSFIRSVAPTGVGAFFDDPTLQNVQIWDIASGLNDDVWLGYANVAKLGRYSASGTHLADYTLGDPINGVTQVAVDPAGNVWALATWFTPSGSGRLYKLGPDGTKVSETDIGGGVPGNHCLGIGADGTVWLCRGGDVLRYSNTGTLKSTTPLNPQQDFVYRLAVGRSGGWVISQNRNRLVHLAP